LGHEIKKIDDEIPFDIPRNWCWARLKNIFFINPRNFTGDELEASFIPMPLISDGFSNEHSYEKRRWSEIKNGFTHFQNGDIGIAKITPCFENRKSVIFTRLINGIGAGTTELHILREILPKTVLAEYVLWFVKTEFFINGGKENFTGTAGQQRVNKSYIENSFLPVPPIAEQSKIIIAIKLAFDKLNLLK
jgi:type I restriction enzyme S subunit